MGNYLNPGNIAFQESLNSEIYIDKSGILGYCCRQIQTRQKYICVSRPRRFGKSMTADMLTAFFDESCDSAAQFRNLHIAGIPDAMEHLNHYHVIHLNMQNLLSMARSMPAFLTRMQKLLLHEIIKEFGEIDYVDTQSLPDCMGDVFTETNIPFVIVIDEWDCLFREFSNDFEAQKQYLDFLRMWLKDRTYVGLCYMTGILPIKKYGTHSALNMFSEFSMEDPGELAEFVGFTENEVKSLCLRYHMDFDECSHWYNGYSFVRCSHIYNPKSIVSAMLGRIFDDYWNKTETYEALKIYIDMNYDGLRDAILAMMAGDRVHINTGSFQNDMTSFSNADDVMTLLVHLGYLGFDFLKSEVFIPNHEIMLEFITATTVGGWEEVVRSVGASHQLLEDTWNRNEDKVASAIAKAHLETSHLQYNDENALSYTISLAYYAAREYYTVIRELPSGNGFADLTFIPRRKYADKPAMVIELKWDKTADSAIAQIHKKNYTDALSEYKGSILLVGINYNKSTREHECLIESLRK